MEKTKELVTSQMLEQIESTIWLQERHVAPMSEEEKEYTRRSLHNLVHTCLFLAQQEKKKSPSQPGE